jgi:carbonic anhydrase
VDALVELNVLEQARSVCRTTVAQDAWQRGQSVSVHGWVYGLHNGLLQDLSFSVGSPETVSATYESALVQVKRRWWLRHAERSGV